MAPTHWKFSRKARASDKQHEREQMARLESAEADVRDLRRRADAAIRALDARRERNHWRESIEQIIQGAS